MIAPTVCTISGYIRNTSIMYKVLKIMNSLKIPAFFTSRSPCYMRVLHRFRLPPLVSSDYSPLVSSDYSPLVSSDYSPLVSSDYSPLVSSDYSPLASSDYPLWYLDYSPLISSNTSSINAFWWIVIIFEPIRCRHIKKEWVINQRIPVIIQ